MSMNRRSFLNTTSALTTAALASNSFAAGKLKIPAKAKRIIFLFMSGGPSHVDTFDYKPELIKADGKSYDFKGVRFNTFGKLSQRQLMKPLWGFNQHGQSGAWVSDLFPHISQHVDELCFIKSMHTEGVAHGPSTLFLHTGATNAIRPSIGSWVNYGIGSNNPNLPGFITIKPSASKGGPRNYSNAFLPAQFQGTAIGNTNTPAWQANFKNLKSTHLNMIEQKRQFQLTQALNKIQYQRSGKYSEFSAIIESNELARRIQHYAPKVLDSSNESQETLRMYGIDNKLSKDFGYQCLMARKLAEADVRFIQVNYADESVNPRWDQHSNMPRHWDHACATDKPVAGLLADLKQRGLLDDTIVCWGGEFGRTPFAQGKDGRDHNPRGFTIWLAGGGFKSGHTHGETDEVGNEAIRDKVHMHDLHATLLYALGINHEELTYRFSGRDFRLTDVAGNVIHSLFT